MKIVNGHLSMTTLVSKYQNVSIMNFIAAKNVGGGGNNWSYKTCKAPAKSSPSINKNTIHTNGTKQIISDKYSTYD